MLPTLRRDSAQIVRRASSNASKKEALILTSDQNRVRTAIMNDPKRLNGWTEPMLLALKETFENAAADSDVDVLILSGAGKYYCAGVNLSGVLRPMHPQALHDLIYARNKAVFDQFLQFPKPVIAAINGPAIGASVTTATLCDALLVAEAASLSTPFARLGVPPEGCSSVHFAALLGSEAAAQRILGAEGWAPTASEAVDSGLARGPVVSPPEELLPAAQCLAEKWITNGRLHRSLPLPPAAGPRGGADGALGAEDLARAARLLEEYARVNERESRDLARAFLGPAFLAGQRDFLKSKGKNGNSAFFSALLAMRPMWSKLLSEDADILRYQRK